MTVLIENIHNLTTGAGAYGLVNQLPHAVPHKKPATRLGIPSLVVGIALRKQCSAVRAWREHYGMSQSEVAQRMGITPHAYAQIEDKKTIYKPTREKVAKALGIHHVQLDF